MDDQKLAEVNQNKLINKYMNKQKIIINLNFRANATQKKFIKNE